MDDIFAFVIYSIIFGPVAIILGILMVLGGLLGLKRRNRKIYQVISLGGGCLLTLGILFFGLAVYLNALFY